MFKLLKDFWISSYNSDRIAFWYELVSVVFTIVGSVLLTFGAPNPNMSYVFPIYLIGSITLAIGSYRRRIIWTTILASWFTIMNVIGNIKVFFDV
jgi:hypothetical protein|tara:strand:- start:117 stop:401 length:285 start_codon:yes stop_codon:yes gene_type:complete